MARKAILPSSRAILLSNRTILLNSRAIFLLGHCLGPFQHISSQNQNFQAAILLLQSIKARHNKANARIQARQPAGHHRPDRMQQGDDGPHARVVALFFGDSEAMQRTLAVLCESNHKQQADTVTQTALMLLSSPVHVQLTAVGWQPLKGRELTFPYMQMTLGQRMALKALLDEGAGMWHVYERAMMYRRSGPPITLKPLPVLEALCTSVLASTAYPDKRVRVAICNILLQRVQASIPIERSVQASLNARLFPPSPSAAASNTGGTPPAE
jgi:hypothetical protein